MTEIRSSEDLDYLAIPEDYCRWLGGLRWCPSGEAVEHIARDPEIGCTFAMSGEIALFLEGYCSGGPLICFGLILHLLHLLDVGASAGGPDPPGRVRPERFNDLAAAFRETGRPIRNAGTLCARLCRDVPRAASRPDLTDLGLRLRCLAMTFPFFERRAGRLAEVPPLDPEEFETRVHQALSGLSRDELRHWLRHGRGPVQGAGEAIERAWPRDLDFRAVLADLGQRPRLAGALPLVERLDGALALPPRRLARTDLPTGGYADIATRGRPEHLLPAQFALDTLEFLRRFAEHELLYFHREEPHAHAAEELVLVVDQGVRTWGNVRLVLAAAALAMVRRAARRGIPSRIATTAAPDRLLDCDGVDPETLGALLEASDLSPHPGAALAYVLDEHDHDHDHDHEHDRDPADRLRDVVLMTHPRSLAEPDVVAASSRDASGTRLFAIAVDGDGAVAVVELRRGVPVAIGGCRVEVDPPAAPEPGPATTPERRSSRIDLAAWRGDVEPIGFPFRFGVHNAIENDRFAFDESGDWLLAAVRPHGPLHAWWVDGTSAEILPQVRVKDTVFSQVRAVIGVAGGFVVRFRGEEGDVAAHYDFNERLCNAHKIPPARYHFSWIYLRHLHSIVIRDDQGQFEALDLGVGKERAARTRRAVQARREAPSAFERAPSVVAVNRPLPLTGAAVRLDAVNGTVAVQFATLHRRHYLPQSDGRPALEGGRILEARAAGDDVVVLFRTPRQSFVEWFSQDQSVPTASYSLPQNVTSFAISRDGRRFACRVGDRRLVIRDVGGGPVPLFVTPKGKLHTTLNVALGFSFLTVTIGRHAHLIHWESGRLEMGRNEEGDLDALFDPRYLLDGAGRVQAEGRSRIPGAGHRFVAECRFHGLKALVDVFGQVAVCDAWEGALIVMFFVFRDQVAAWMPDCTRIGPLPIIGGPPTPDGPERIGAALRMAQAQTRPPEGARRP